MFSYDLLSKSPYAASLRVHSDEMQGAYPFAKPTSTSLRLWKP